MWEWFREARVSSSEVICASPSTRRGQDLRFLREMDFALCPLPDPGSIAGSTTTTFSTKTRWWFHKNKPQSSTKGVFEKTSENVKAGLYGKGPSSTTSVVKYELGEEELALPKLDPEEYWENYGNEDSGITVRCFELECPPEFDLPPSSSSPSSSSLSLVALFVVSLHLHLLIGWIGLLVPHSLSPPACFKGRETPDRLYTPPLPTLLWTNIKGTAREKAGILNLPPTGLITFQGC